MIQISWNDVTKRARQLREQLGAGVKWWAEHQAWPATDEIRIERPRTPCC